MKPLLALLLALSASPLAAQQHASFQVERTFPGTPDAVWAALTTPEGVSKWLARGGRIELRLDGPYELFLNDDAVHRNQPTMKSRVLGFVPNEMLSYSGGLPGTWTVWRIDPAENGRVRVRFSAHGTSPEWTQAMSQFQPAMEQFLEKLAAAVAAK